MDFESTLGQLKARLATISQDIETLAPNFTGCEARLIRHVVRDIAEAQGLAETLGKAHDATRSPSGVNPPPGLYPGTRLYTIELTEQGRDEEIKSLKEIRRVTECCLVDARRIYERLENPAEGPLRVYAKVEEAAKGLDHITLTLVEEG